MPAGAVERQDDDAVTPALRAMKHRLCDPVRVISLDFAEENTSPFPLKQDFAVVATESGTAHAILLFWEVEDGGLVMSTEPRATLDTFPRDMQWGQALQLLDGETEVNLPTPVTLEQGRTYKVACKTSYAA